MFSALTRKETTPAQTPVLDPAAAQDALRLKVLMQDRDAFQARIDAGLVIDSVVDSNPRLKYRSPSEVHLASLDAEIAQTQARIDARLAAALTEANRQEARRTSMTPKVEHTTKKLEHVLELLAQVESEVGDLEADLDQIWDVYGRRVGNHVLEVPTHLGIIRTLAQAFGRHEGSQIHRWRKAAEAHGLAMRAPKRAR